MNNFLLDIGNSCIKTGVGKHNSSEISLVKRFYYSKDTFEKDFIKNFPDIKNKYFSGAGISIQSKSCHNFLGAFFKKRYNINPVFITRDMKLPVKINYSEGIGTDRICNAAAADALYKKKNILIIDFGTATTFTLVSDSILSGGLISPGLKTSLDSLLKNTNLPEVKISAPAKLITRDTINNIKAGVFFQCLYSVQRVIKEVKREYRNLFVVSTGGFSEIISSELKEINIIDRNLTLKGINIILTQ